MLPVSITLFDVLLNVNALLPSTRPLSENNNVVFGAVMFIFACTLPTSVPTVTTLPAGNVTLPVLS